MYNLKDGKKNPCQYRILYPMKVSLKNVGEIKPFSRGIKLAQFLTSTYAL